MSESSDDAPVMRALPTATELKQQLVSIAECIRDALNPRDDDNSSTVSSSSSVVFIPVDLQHIIVQYLTPYAVVVQTMTGTDQTANWSKPVGICHTVAPDTGEIRLFVTDSGAHRCWSISAHTRMDACFRGDALRNREFID